MNTTRWQLVGRVLAYHLASKTFSYSAILMFFLIGRKIHVVIRARE
uniref:Uncharacterized protein n=1 Tax=Parascaris equorum TaxID=6256 RepID=A0A914RX09_PAREQ